MPRAKCVSRRIRRVENLLQGIFRSTVVGNYFWRVGKLSESIDGQTTNGGSGKLPSLIQSLTQRSCAQLPAIIGID